jgi:hypothetical protein
VVALGSCLITITEINEVRVINVLSAAAFTEQVTGAVRDKMTASAHYKQNSRLAIQGSEYKYHFMCQMSKCLAFNIRYNAVHEVVTDSCATLRKARTYSVICPVN